MQRRFRQQRKTYGSHVAAKSRQGRGKTCHLGESFFFFLKRWMRLDCLPRKFLIFYFSLFYEEKKENTALQHRSKVINVGKVRDPN